MQTPSLLCLSAADDLLAHRPIVRNPYFADLLAGNFDKAAFTATQRQFFHAVGYFSRPMAALMARLPDSASRRTLMHNLSEEHGYDETDGGFHAGMAHDQTFLDFLETLGVTRAAMASEPAGATVRSFNLALHGACLSEPPNVAFAALAMIEYMFADISAIIGKTVVERGWIAQADLVHYTLHAEVDRRHSAEFFAVVEPAWRRGGTDAQEVAAGLGLGWHIFDRLYRELRESGGDV